MVGTVSKRPVLAELCLWLLVEWTACPPKKARPSRGKKP